MERMFSFYGSLYTKCKLLKRQSCSMCAWVARGGDLRSGVLHGIPGWLDVRMRRTPPSYRHCLGGMAKTGAPCSHYVACDTVNDYMNAQHSLSPPPENRGATHVQLYAHFLSAGWLPIWKTPKPKQNRRNSPSDVKIFATNVLVPTWWKPPPALFSASLFRSITAPFSGFFPLW